MLQSAGRAKFPPDQQDRLSAGTALSTLPLPGTQKLNALLAERTLTQFVTGSVF
ncbi:MAG: hypothetical protein ACM3ZV_13555 [Bacillota bacterium]